jgi:quinolinate synthase
MAKVTAKKLLRTLTDISKGKSAPLAVKPAQVEPARLSLTRMLEICA